jgi:cytochrome bd-type quinol oxidase subunit 2
MPIYFRVGVLVAFAAIVVSLGSALYHLSRGTQQDSAKLARALTVRIALSLALFVLIMLAWYAGLITPHGVIPQRH